MSNLKNLLVINIKFLVKVFKTGWRSLITMILTALQMRKQKKLRHINTEESVLYFIRRTNNLLCTPSCNVQFYTGRKNHVIYLVFIIDSQNSDQVKRLLRTWSNRLPSMKGSLNLWDDIIMVRYDISLKFNFQHFRSLSCTQYLVFLKGKEWFHFYITSSS